MKKYLKAVTNIVIAFIVLLFVFFLVPKLIWFFAPFFVGWIISVIASPMVRFFEEKLKIRRKAGSAFVIIIVIALVVFVLYLVGMKLTEEIVGLAEALPAIWVGLEAELAEIGEKLSVVYEKLPADARDSITDISGVIGDYFGSLMGNMGSPTIEAVGNVAKQLPNIVIAIIMALLSAYFFVADKENIYAWLRNHMPEEIQRKYGIIRKSLVKAVGGYFKAQLKIECWIYLLLVVGLSFLQVNYTLLIALGIAFLDLLPFFGTGTVMVPWAIIKVLSGDYKMAVWLLIIWGVGQLVRQIIQPKIVGDSVGMPPLPTLILLYLGYRVAGVIGMIVSVPIGLIVVTMYEEGVFDITRKSIKIIVDGINNFRKID